jgi:hypothetical protein
MKITIETAKEFAANVMDSRQLADYNAWAGTSHESTEDLIENESAEKIAEFFNP